MCAFTVTGALITVTSRRHTGVDGCEAASCVFIGYVEAAYKIRFPAIS